MKVFTGADLFDTFSGISEGMAQMEQMLQPPPAKWRRVLLRLAGYDYRDFRPLPKPTRTDA